MKTLTVFTPTYNRAHLLPRVYASLKNQTCQDFVWMIVDDGSTDETRALVEKWKQEEEVEIIYLYKENGGMHTGHNLAYQSIKTELNVCVDSDDFMPDDAVQKILSKWNQVTDRESFSGIVALDADMSGKIIGTKMPSEVIVGSYHDLYTLYKAKGDKKFVLKTKRVKHYSLYPEYQDEKLVPLGILYIMMGEDKPFVFLDEVICIVEYQEGGSSHTILKQYFQSPKGFAYARKIRLKYSKSIKDILKNCLHLAALFFITKQFQLIWKDNPYKILTISFLPLGFIFYQYLKTKK